MYWWTQLKHATTTIMRKMWARNRDRAARYDVGLSVNIKRTRYENVLQSAQKNFFFHSFNKTKKKEKNIWFIYIFRYLFWFCLFLVILFLKLLFINNVTKNKTKFIFWDFLCSFFPLTPANRMIARWENIYIVKWLKIEKLDFLFDVQQHEVM